MSFICVLTLYTFATLILFSMNMIVVTDSAIHVLDVAAKLDAKAAPLCKKEWGQPQFAPALSRELLPQVI